MVWSHDGGQVWVQGGRALGHGAVLVGTCEQIWKKGRHEPRALLITSQFREMALLYYYIISSKTDSGTSLVVQWLRICLAMQGM